MERLFKNRGGYFGETIDIQAVLKDVLESARRHDWQIEEIKGVPDMVLIALHRLAARPRLNLYLSTGIHGDEPAGTLAVRQLLQDNVWPAYASLWVCPCLNPTGFPLNRRENARGLDLNRDYRHLRTAEAREHVAWLNRQPAFDITLCLHEDWEAQGFYLYELNPENRPSFAPEIIEAVSKVCPIDPSEVIEGRPARNGIISPSLDPNSRPQWPESFYLLQNKTRHSYTLEAPSDFPLDARVAALVAAVKAVLARRDEPASP